MKQELRTLMETGLFRGIDGDEIQAMIRCMGAYTERYSEGEFLFRRGDRVDWIGVVLDGKVSSVKEDWWGNRTLIAEYGKGQQICCEYACSPDENLDVSMVASSQCKVLMFNIAKVTNVCTSSCEFHNRMIKNIMKSLAADSISLNKRLDQLSKRSTRERICAFLSDQARRAGSDDFFIPFNRQEMADHLGVERSAMSAELGRMQRDGILEFEKNHFILK